MKMLYSGEEYKISKKKIYYLSSLLSKGDEEKQIRYITNCVIREENLIDLLLLNNEKQ